MRMDRYDEEDSDISKKSRTNKNQELYTDVYLNNAYVDISEINEVTKEDEEIKKEFKEPIKEEVTYTYKEKNYDINDLIKNAIENNNDNLKRSLEHTTEIDGIIKSINEAQKEKNDNEKEELLDFLMPENDTTTIVGPLENAISDTKMIDTSIIHKDEMSNEILDELEKEETKEETINQKIENKEIEIDKSFENETKIDKKKIFIIVGVSLLILIIIGILFITKVIKF